MENWEFLLQKQGDKSWLPLESTTVEILEGFYRLASRTMLANALVGIQLSYMPSSGLQSPSRQKFSKRINAEGLLIVMPYTCFTAGIWQIECINLDPELQQSKVKSVSVCLDVQPISAEGMLAELAEPIATQSEVNNLEADLDLGQDSVSLLQVESPSAQLSVRSEDAVITEPLALPVNLIALHQSQYLASETLVPVLSGISYLPGELEVVLRNPQDLEIVMQTSFTLESAQTSNWLINFSFELRVPPSTSQVMIGEVRLIPAIDISLPDSQNHVYYQAIAITFQSQNILSKVARELAIAAQPQTQEELSHPSSNAIARSTNHPQPPIIQSHPPAPNPQPPIQPVPRPQIKLPEFPKISTLSQARLDVVPPESADLDCYNSEDLLEQLLEEHVENIPEIELQDKLAPLPFTETASPDLLDAEKKTEGTFTSLPAGDRFLDKLQSLSKESLGDNMLSQQVSDLIEAEIGKLESEIDRVIGLEDLGEEFDRMLLEDELLAVEDRAANELLAEPKQNLETQPVFDRTSQSDLDLVEEAISNSDAIGLEIPENVPDDFPERENERAEQPRLQETETPASEALEALHEVLTASAIIDRAAAPKQQDWQILSPNEALPIPILEIPEGEVIGGVPMPVLVRLPSVRSQLFVKLWVKDCQTRSIVDGPRWLVDFQRESGADYLTLCTTIALPLGVMEVAFEAVAIEMQTQRESRKTTTTRIVAPPNLVLEDDLDFDPPDA